jgi:hypothetical protein
LLLGALVDELEAGESTPELLVHAVAPVPMPTTSSAATTLVITLPARMLVFLPQVIDQDA